MIAPDELVVTEKLFKVACVLLAAEELKRENKITGGPEVLDFEALRRIERIGREKGFSKPSSDEIPAIISALENA